MLGNALMPACAAIPTTPSSLLLLLRPKKVPRSGQLESISVCSVEVARDLKGCSSCLNPSQLLVH